MRPLIWLTKRRYMHKDLIGDRFGRYFEIPKRLGRPVTMFALDYAGAPRDELTDGPLTIRSYPLSDTLGFLRDINEALHDQPDAAVMSGADAPYCLLGEKLARRYGRPCLFDIYDDFDTFASARLPMIKSGFRKALSRADGVISFEARLSSKLEAMGASRCETVPNGVDPAIFHPAPKSEARQALSLPEKAPIIGHFGAMTRERHIDDLFEAFAHLRAKYPDAVLLLAGPHDDSVALTAPGVDYRGMVSQIEVAQMLNACDVAVSTVRAEICFPFKLMEYIACRTPLVTPNTGGAEAVLADFPHFMYPPGDPDRLAERIISHLTGPPEHFPEIFDWDMAAADFDRALERMLAPPAALLAKAG